MVVRSSVCNWQQANRLMWIGTNRFIYNDFINGKYVSIENKNGSNLIHKFPIYDSTDKIAVSVFLDLGMVTQN